MSAKSTAIELAVSLFSLLDTRQRMARLDAFREVSPDYLIRRTPTTEIRTAAESAYTLACERYEAAVVESVREALDNDNRLLEPI